METLDLDSFGIVAKSMSLHDLVSLAATKRIYRDWAHAEIARRHKGLFGETHKSMENMIKDIRFYELAGNKLNTPTIQAIILEPHIKSCYWYSFTSHEHVRNRLRAIAEYYEPPEARTRVILYRNALLKSIHKIAILYPQYRHAIINNLNFLIEYLERAGDEYFLPRSSYYRADVPAMADYIVSAHIRAINDARHNKTNLYHNAILYRAATDDVTLRSWLGHDSSIDSVVRSLGDVRDRRLRDPLVQSHYLNEADMSQIIRLLEHRALKMGRYSVAFGSAQSAPEDYDTFTGPKDYIAGLLRGAAVYPVSEIRRSNMSADVLAPYMNVPVAADPSMDDYTGLITISVDGNVELLLDPELLPEDVNVCYFARGVATSTHRRVRITDHRDIPDEEKCTTRLDVWHFN